MWNLTKPSKEGFVFNRILIIKWSALGDVVLATSAFEDIAHAYPDAEIHLNTLPQWKPLFEADPRFRKIIALPVKTKKGQIRVIKNWLIAIGKERYDVIFDFQENDRSRLFLFLLWLTGRAPRYCIHGRSLLKTIPHDFDRMQRILEQVQITPKTTHPALYPSERQFEKVRLIQAEYRLLSHRYLIFMVGSHPAWKTKRWGQERYLALAKLSHQQGVDKIVLIGDTAEETCCDFVATAGPWVVNLCKKLELLDIPILAQDAIGSISNDTGPAHLLAAAQKPLLVICGPTDPLRVKPIGPHVKTLQAELPCIRCYQPTCSHQSCMKAITPEMVLQAFYS